MITVWEKQKYAHGPYCGGCRAVDCVEDGSFDCEQLDSQSTILNHASFFDIVCGYHGDRKWQARSSRCLKYILRTGGLVWKVARVSLKIYTMTKAINQKSLALYRHLLRLCKLLKVRGPEGAGAYYAHRVRSEFEAYRCEADEYS